MYINGMAMVFPGQGAQKVGMGFDFYNHSKRIAELFRQSDEILGYSISELCFKGPDTELTKTVNTQPAIFINSVAGFMLLRERGFEPIMTAGHSVGEYCALVASGVLDFESALRLVAYRGTLMQSAGNDTPGTMAAVMGLDYETIKKCCMDSSSEGIVEIANFNTPEQIVISGEIPAVEKAMELLKAKGAKRVLLLNVGAAFHSRLMTSAANELAVRLDETIFRKPSIPVAVNYTGELLTDPAKIKAAMKKQMLGSVLWVDAVKNMVKNGAYLFVEAGPGKALSGMIKKIDLGLKTLNIEDMASLDKATECLNEESKVLQTA